MNYSKGKTIYYNQLLKHVEQGSFAPAYLVFGEEYLLMENIINRLKAKLLQKVEPELNFFIRYGSENGVDAVVSLGAGMGLFSAKKLIILKEAEAIKQKELAKLSKFLQKSSPDIYLILQTNVTSLNQTRLKKVQDLVVPVNLLPLRAKELNQFIHEEFEKYGKEIKSEACDMLIFLVGHQLSDLSTQVNNISQYFSDKDTIETSDVELVASVYATQDVFEFNRLIGKKNIERGLFVLHNLLDSGMSPQQILSQLMRHFSFIWQIQGFYRSGIRSNDTIAKELKIYPKYFKEYADQAKQWHFSSVSRVFNLFHKVDYELKNSSSDPKIILDMLSYQIINC